MGKINVYDKIINENKMKNRENMKIKERIFARNSS